LELVTEGVELLGLPVGVATAQAALNGAAWRRSDPLHRGVDPV
jgi:hypothetical protein